jgi:hypothetical protein
VASRFSRYDAFEILTLRERGVIRLRIHGFANGELGEPWGVLTETAMA